MYFAEISFTLLRRIYQNFHANQMNYKFLKEVDLRSVEH